MIKAQLCFVCLALVCSACGPSATQTKPQVGANPDLPPIHQSLLPSMHLASKTDWGQDKPTVPSNLRIALFAKDLKNPRSVYVLPNGDVLVAEPAGPEAPPPARPKDMVMGWMEKLTHSSTKGANDIILFRDTNGDGIPDTRTVFLSHLTAPFGLSLVGDRFYVADTDAIISYPYQAGDTAITAAGTKLCDLPAFPIDHHWTKSLTASPDGKRLYVGVGSNSNITENGVIAEVGRASIWEIDVATGAHREFATGLRNPAGVQFEPSSNTLWAIVNERDELGPNLVPDYLTSVKSGAFYGWPYSYWGKHIDPRVQPRRDDLVAKAIAPDYALGSHVAPLGLVFDTGQSLPPQYRGGVFISEHGSWNRSKFNGYKVVFIPFAGGHPSGVPQDVVTGFLSGDNMRGRPVGLALDKQGALLVVDDVGNRVWRVAAR